MDINRRTRQPHDALEVAEVMRGIRRAWQRPAVQKAPVLEEDRSASARRSRRIRCRACAIGALLLLGFAGALRRSELVALDIEHLAYQREGLQIRILSSRTDQEGEGNTA